MTAYDAARVARENRPDDVRQYVDAIHLSIGEAAKRGQNYLPLPIVAEGLSDPDEYLWVSIKLALESDGYRFIDMESPAPPTDETAPNYLEIVRVIAF